LNLAAVTLQIMQMILAAVRGLYPDRSQLILENLALRQQVAALKRERPRPLLTDMDRLFWVALREKWSDWANALIIVKAETVVRWHRAAFKRHWARLSGSGKHPGRPCLTAEIKTLIRKMATENAWGAPRIHAELLKLDFDIAEVTVSRHLPKRPADPDKVARWKTFLKNHLPEIAAMDFLTIPTATFQVLYCFFVIHHDRRRILHFNITSNPTGAWVLQQLREAFFDEPRIKYLIHDRDSKFNGVVEWLKSAGAKSVRTAYRSPWQNGICERFCLTLRSDLLNHVVVFNEAHARRLIADFLVYYHEDRCHLSLDKDSPEPRPIQGRPHGDAKVVAFPRVGGIHDRYEWRDAA
jgi:putative transposase